MSPSNSVPPLTREVYEYLDYRCYLRDHYLHHKEHEYGFSYRVFARRAGCRSSNFAQLVIAGKRNLSPDSALRFAEACGLSGRGRGYFCALVAFNQAETQREKEHTYRELSRFPRFRRVQAITEARANYFSEWFIVATRELAARGDFTAKPEWIARMLKPQVTIAQARLALDTLQQLGFLAKDDEGILRPTETLVSADGALGHHLVAFHQAMLQRASEAIDLIDRSERDISALTVCVSEERMQQLIEEVRSFRKHLLQIAESEDVPERVVQLGFQVFPLSQKRPPRIRRSKGATEKPS